MPHSCVRGPRPPLHSDQCWLCAHAAHGLRRCPLSEAVPADRGGARCPRRCSQGRHCPRVRQARPGPARSLLPPGGTSAHRAPAGGHGRNTLRPFLRTATAQAEITDLHSILPKSEQLRRRRVTAHFTPSIPEKDRGVLRALLGFLVTDSAPIFRLLSSKASENLKNLIPHQPWAAPTERFSFCSSACIHHFKNEISSRLRVFWLLFQSLPGPGKRMSIMAVYSHSLKVTRALLPLLSTHKALAQSLSPIRPKWVFKAVNAATITLFCSHAPSIRQFRTKAPASSAFNESCHSYRVTLINFIYWFIIFCSKVRKCSSKGSKPLRSRETRIW